MDKTFRDGLKEHKMVPSAAVWEKVESHLNDKQEKKGYYWYAAIAAALIITFAFSSLIRWNTGNSNEFIPRDELVVQPEEEMDEGVEHYMESFENPFETKASIASSLEKSKSSQTIEVVDANGSENMAARFESAIEVSNRRINALAVAEHEAELKDEDQRMDLSQLEGQFIIVDDENKTGEVVLDYAKEQLYNWASGDGIELPKPKIKKPKLDVYWNKLFASGN